jgi:hypothetical protein
MRSLLSSIALIALLAGCASGPQLRVDQDPSADLKAYKTFAFYEHAASDRAGYASIVTQRLRHSTREQLEKLGYAYSEQAPDLRVNFFVNVADKQELRSTSTGPAFRGYRGWGTQLETVSYRQGTLRIDLVDAGRNAMVWQGVAEGHVDPKAEQQPGASVDAVVAAIFERFPGGKGA